MNVAEFHEKIRCKASKQDGRARRYQTKESSPAKIAAHENRITGSRTYLPGLPIADENANPIKKSRKTQ